MALSMLQSVMLVQCITNNFSQIGKTFDTCLPEITVIRNNESIAYEFLVAQTLSKMAQKRLEAAELAALDAGIIVDKKSSTKQPGCDEDCYTGNIIAVHLGVKAGRKTISEASLKTALTMQQMSASVIEKIIRAAQKESAPPHTFTARFRRPGE